MAQKCKIEQALDSQGDKFMVRFVLFNKLANNKKKNRIIQR